MMERIQESRKGWSRKNR